MFWGSNVSTKLPLATEAARKICWRASSQSAARSSGAQRRSKPALSERDQRWFGWHAQERVRFVIANPHCLQEQVSVFYSLEAVLRYSISRGQVVSKHTHGACAFALPYFPP